MGAVQSRHAPRPIIAVTCDTRAAHERDRPDHWRYESHSTYGDAIARFARMTRHRSA